MSSEQRALQSRDALDTKQQQQEHESVSPVDARPTRTDPGFPGRWGERASTGFLNAGSRALSRTTPDFMGVVRGGRPSKYASTIDAFPMENATTQNVTFEVLPGDLEPPCAEAPGAQRSEPRPPIAPIAPTWPSVVPAPRASAAATPPSNETIDELIDGLPLEVPPRRKRERRAGDASRSSSSKFGPHRAPPPGADEALGVGPEAYRPRLSMPSLPSAIAGPRREPRSSRVPPHGSYGRRGPFAVVAISLLLTCLVVPFIVVHFSKGEPLGDAYRVPISTTVALSVAIQPPAPPPISEPVVERVSAPLHPAIPQPLSQVGAVGAAAHPAVGSNAANKRPTREQAARTEVPQAARADELESDIGAPTPSPPPRPSPSQSAADLLTGH